MGTYEVTRIDFTGVIAIAMSVIGFISVWIKIGHDKGRLDAVIKNLEQKTEKNEKDIAEIENKTHGIELHIAKFMGEIGAKLDAIKETVSELKPKGVTRAAKK